MSLIRRRIIARLYTLWFNLHRLNHSICRDFPTSLCTKHRVQYKFTIKSRFFQRICAAAISLSLVASPISGPLRAYLPADAFKPDLYKSQGRTDIEKTANGPSGSLTAQEIRAGQIEIAVGSFLKEKHPQVDGAKIEVNDKIHEQGAYLHELKFIKHNGIGRFTNVVDFSQLPKLFSLKPAQIQAAASAARDEFLKQYLPQAR